MAHDGGTGREAKVSPSLALRVGVVVACLASRRFLHRKGGGVEWMLRWIAGSNPISAITVNSPTDFPASVTGEAERFVATSMSLTSAACAYRCRRPHTIASPAAILLPVDWRQRLEARSHAASTQGAAATVPDIRPATVIFRCGQKPFDHAKNAGSVAKHAENAAGMRLELGKLRIPKAKACKCLDRL